MIIKILETPTYKKGTARAKWFTAIKRYDGKELDAVLHSVQRLLYTQKQPLGW